MGARRAGFAPGAQDSTRDRDGGRCRDLGVRADPAPDAQVIDIILLGLAFAAGTLFVGWWSIPIIALVWGWLVGPARRPATRAAIGVALAWAGFLAFDAVRGPIGRLARTLGET